MVKGFLDDARNSVFPTVVGKLDNANEIPRPFLYTQVEPLIWIVSLAPLDPALRLDEQYWSLEDCHICVVKIGQYNIFPAIRREWLKFF